MDGEVGEGIPAILPLSLPERFIILLSLQSILSFYHFIILSSLQSDIAFYHSNMTEASMKLHFRKKETAAQVFTISLGFGLICLECCDSSLIFSK